jgi:hypothetical protein
MDSMTRFSWHARKGHLQRAFHLEVLIVPSSVLAIAADDERLTCSGFSLHETIHIGSFKSIVAYFDGLSLCPKRGSSGAAFMGSTHSETPSS